MENFCKWFVIVLFITVSQISEQKSMLFEILVEIFISQVVLLHKMKRFDMLLNESKDLMSLITLVSLLTRNYGIKRGKNIWITDLQ